MTLTDAEKVLLKQFGHELIDKDLPQAVTLAVAHLPTFWAAMAQMILAAVTPQITVIIDAKIDAMTAPAVLPVGV